MKADRTAYDVGLRRYICTTELPKMASAGG